MRLIRGFFKVVGGTIKWTLMIGALLIVVVIIVAIVGLGKGVSNANKEAARLKPLMPKVAIGWTETQVKHLLGKPDSTDSSTVAGLGTSIDWYYGTLATKGGNWQLVFQDGRLSEKNHY